MPNSVTPQTRLGPRSFRPRSPVFAHQRDSHAPRACLPPSASCPNRRSCGKRRRLVGARSATACLLALQIGHLQGTRLHAPSLSKDERGCLLKGPELPTRSPGAPLALASSPGRQPIPSLPPGFSFVALSLSTFSEQNSGPWAHPSFLTPYTPKQPGPPHSWAALLWSLLDRSHLFSDLPPHSAVDTCITHTLSRLVHA